MTRNAGAKWKKNLEDLEDLENFQPEHMQAKCKKKQQSIGVVCSLLVVERGIRYVW